MRFSQSLAEVDFLLSRQDTRSATGISSSISRMTDRKPPKLVVGFVNIVTAVEKINIFYLSVRQTKRGNGLGASSLCQLQETRNSIQE